MSGRRLGKRKYPQDENENKSITPNEFINEVYDKNRDIINGRSHSMLKKLEITIDDTDGSRTTISERTVSNTVSEFQRTIKHRDSDLGQEIQTEIDRNLVRIDMVYNICKILNKSKWNNMIRLRFEIYGQNDFDDNTPENIDGNESESLADHDFYAMIKHWIVSDHYNPTIRCEMIWDMLLSDFICDMMRKMCDPQGTGKKILLLAKEFPYSKIPYNSMEENRKLKGPKVDYLVGVEEDKKLYFVELKTDPGSFVKAQRDAYMNYVEQKAGYTIDDLWNRYIEIARKAGNNKRYYYYSGSEKYRYQIDRMKEICGEGINDRSDELFLEDMKNKYVSIELVYITFEKIDREDINQIIIRDGKDDNLRILKLENEDDDEKRNRWSLVMDIIKETMDNKGMPSPIPVMKGD